jgi:hypothetical protein
LNIDFCGNITLQNIENNWMGASVVLVFNLQIMVGEVLPVGSDDRNGIRSIYGVR